MHKRLVNHCTISLVLKPDGPILIKSGKEGADPTKPDMEFVETYHAGGRSVYLPGSSLKGAIRAHAERIVRTVGNDHSDAAHPRAIWANDPLNDSYEYLKKKPSHEVYKLSSFTDQMFGNTSIASRIRIEDAHPDRSQPLKLEERNGVAIDRVFGSVAVGPFNYEVCTSGAFTTRIHLKNFTLAQLGLLGLVLRDLNEGWFGIGFAKSRGLGTVQVEYKSAAVQYPGCLLQDGQIRTLNKQLSCSLNTDPCPHNTILGVGEFLEGDEATLYGFPQQDRQTTPVAASPMDLGFGVQLQWEGDTEEGVHNLFMLAVRSWSSVLQEVA